MLHSIKYGYNQYVKIQVEFFFCVLLPFANRLKWVFENILRKPGITFEWEEKMKNVHFRY